MNALYRIMLPYMKLASSGVLVDGSFEPQTSPAPDGIDRAFATNDAVDDGSRMAEPGVVNGGVNKTAAGIKLPKTGVIKPPKAPTVPAPKPSTSLDKGTSLSAGTNPVQDLQTMNNGAQATASTSAFANRLQGSPA